MDRKRVDDVLYEYIVKFEDTPPLLYGCDYHDEAVLAIIENAIKTGKKLTLNDYPDDMGERVITLPFPNIEGKKG